MKFGAGILVVSASTGRFLLAKRGSKITYPGQWTNFGGGSDANETPFETAKREFKEESGYSGRVLKYYPSYVSNNNRNKFVFYNYIAVVGDEFAPPMVGKKTADGDIEVSDYGWFTFFEITRQKFPFGVLHYGIKDLFHYKKTQLSSILKRHCKKTHL